MMRSGVVVLHAALDACKVARRVVVAAVGLPDDRHSQLLLLELDDERTLRLLGEPRLQQPVDDAGHQRIVVRFTAVGVELYAELRVHAVEFGYGDVDETLPERKVLRIALLQLHELRLALLAPHAVLLLRLRRGEDIALLKDGDRQVRPLVVRQEVAVALDEDAELSPPVAEVVVCDDLVSKRTEDPVDGVADHGRADVPDVHLLGGVRGGVVDHDLLAPPVLRDAAIGRRVERRKPGVEPALRNGEVEESRPRDLNLLEAGAVKRVRNPLCGVAGLQAHLLGQFQSIVALVVAELGVGRGHHADAAEILPGERLLKGRFYNVCERHRPYIISKIVAKRWIQLNKPRKETRTARDAIARIGA